MVETWGRDTTFILLFVIEKDWKKRVAQCELPSLRKWAHWKMFEIESTTWNSKRQNVLKEEINENTIT